jgi:GNAT superfamily N-acetyltransferase
MKTVTLNSKKHKRKSFDCGVDVLNSYLQNIANQHSKNDISRSYILEDKNDNTAIVGFYTLSLTALSFSKSLQKEFPYTKSAGLIARLAVDKKYHNDGYGEWLLVDALLKLLDASEIVGFPIIVVDAKDGVKEFYKKFGFIEFFDEKDRLFITVDGVRKSFS